MQIVNFPFDHHNEDDGGVENERGVGDQEEHEVTIVAIAHTLIDPHAVMVKHCYAVTT